MRPALPVALLALLLVPAGAEARISDHTTGRLLVTLRAPRGHVAQAATAAAVAARTDARRTTLTIPQLRVVTVRARRGQSLHRLAVRLRADPGVRSVSVEQRFALRYVPNDPAFSTPERGEPGTVTEWWAIRQGLPAAWDLARGNGARVAIIDTGVDASHPDLANKIAATADFDPDPATGPPTVDEVGHGTHVASLACAEADNAIGIAGAGLGCRLLIAKSDLSEGSVAKALVWAADNGADAINMSFGTEGRTPASDTLVQALRYANGRGAVLVAAAADDPVQEQGDPGNVLQPTGTGADPSRNFGLTVTAASAADERAPFAGRGSQISMAAYGTYGAGGSTGLLAAFPAATTSLERQDSGTDQAPCRCRTTYDGDLRYAYLSGTSMAAPVVAGVAALMRRLNPDLPPDRVVALLKQTARRPATVGWEPELGWGILDAGAAVAAAKAIDARRPTSQLLTAKAQGRSIVLRWKGRDSPTPGLTASGIDHFEVWRSAEGRRARRIAVTGAHTLRARGRRGGTYGFYTIAVDRAGNREQPPLRADVRVRVSR